MFKIYSAKMNIYIMQPFINYIFLLSLTLMCMRECKTKDTKFSQVRTKFIALDCPVVVAIFVEVG